MQECRLQNQHPLPTHVTRQKQQVDEVLKPLAARLDSYSSNIVKCQDQRSSTLESDETNCALL